MRSPSAPARPVPRAKPAWGACGLVRWLLVLLLAFDQIGAPWHAHHHDSGVDGSFSSAVHAADAHPALGIETHLDAAAHAPDSRQAWAHATTALRVEAGLAPASADDADAGPAPAWPGVTLVPTAHCAAMLATASLYEPRRPAHRSLPPSPQAPPRRA